jgi:hypothetical protein
MACSSVAAARDLAEREAGRTLLLFVGGAAGDDSSPTLTRLQHRLETVDAQRAVVIFTGNYNDGELPPHGDPARPRAERNVLAHVTATRDFVKRGGKVFYLPGQLDFAQGGTLAVRRLRSFLNHAYADVAGDEGEDEELDVMPHAGCGDPTLLEVSKQIGVLLVDSQWWVQDWDHDPIANEGCEFKTRYQFQDFVHQAFMDYRASRLIVVSHHPLLSYGELGGAFTAKAHLSPLPVIGTAWVFARQAGLVEQYQNHPMVRSYLDFMHDEAQRNGAFVFVSGHDADLQYLHTDQQLQIVSGTSARSAAPTARARKDDFAAASPGWVELDLEPSGAGEVTIKSGESDEVLFSKKLPRPPPPAPLTGVPPPPFPKGPVSAAFSNKHVWNLGAFKPVIGSFYSEAYNLDMPWPTLDLATEQGGFEVKGLGGGLQTNSLRLKDTNGGSWVLRAVTKDPSRLLPWPQNQTAFINRLVEHAYTAEHPEAPLAVARLSEAVGVLHAEPRLYYLPDQERLGRYRGLFANQLVMLEQRPTPPKNGDVPESLVGSQSPDGPTVIRTTDETLDKALDDPYANRIDQEDMLRARLVDMLIGDWDRHHGQWRFAGVPNRDGTRTWRPIARDRDQAFTNYDGAIIPIMKLAVPQARMVGKFDGHYGSIAWLNYPARNIDPTLLNQLTHDRWLAIAREAQGHLTDEVIDEAMATWQPKTYALDGSRIAQSLKMRRDQLVDAADKYYSELSRNVDILGSTRADLIDIWFEPAGIVHVTVRAKPVDHSDAPPFFDRTFYPSETQELRIYALEGDDTLQVHDDHKTPIGVRFIGGAGDDAVTAAPGGKAPLDARNIELFDAKDGATIDPSVKVHDSRSNEVRFNEYDHDENHDPNYSTLFPALQANADQGAWLGLSYAYTVPGFKKQPFAQRHQVSLDFATSTLGVGLGYTGLFPESILGLSQVVDVILRSPNYTRNFYGLTNQVVPDVPDKNFFRVQQGRYAARYGVFGHPGGNWFRVGGGLLAEALVTQDTPGRFVSISPEAQSGLGARYFAGARLFAQMSTFDPTQLPTRGIALHTSAEGRFDVAHGNDFSITWLAAGAFAFPFDRARRFVLISRAKVEGITGSYPFYYAPTLGGSDLRAYHYEQLAGSAAFAQTTDLRIDVFRILTKLPGTIGLKLSVDHGKVFGVTSFEDRYHVNLGGGIWWFFLDTVGLSLNYFQGFDGGSRVTFALAVAPYYSPTGFAVAEPPLMPGAQLEDPRRYP